MLIFHIILVTIGLGLLVWAYREYLDASNFLRMGKRSSARIRNYEVDLAKIDDDEEDVIPIYEFQDDQKRSHTFKVFGRTTKTLLFATEFDIIYVLDWKNGEKKVAEFTFWAIYQRMIIAVCAALPPLVIGISYLLYSFGE